MDIGSVETELAEAWNPDPDAEVGLSAARVVVKLDNIPTGRQGLGEAIKRLKTGRENSNDDHAICCAAVRRGALVVNEVAGALVRLAGDGAREKLKRQDYQTRTAENALRAVLGEVRAHRRGVKAIERAGRAYVFAPTHMPIGNGERNLARLRAAHALGLAQTRRELPAMREFLGLPASG